MQQFEMEENQRVLNDVLEALKNENLEADYSTHVVMNYDCEIQGFQIIAEWDRTVRLCPFTGDFTVNGVKFNHEESAIKTLMDYFVETTF